ncbi:transcriptional activator of ethanol catabolism AlcS [Fistulina hepatica ATCC 64428]|uniref:Transcriptional activator of ethanol catabolism AlcS n=1 Tax=Fistulina hepatica ATCC 64428 TaxID=1128425 RepID=A0A0D7AD41_9AGAR|nr:transcriptional activator of ethanol catabolism AlcS [Fistulina hepatica ATCC 64428]
MSQSEADVEKGTSAHRESGPQVTTTVHLTPEQYERLFLQPGTGPTKGNLVNIVGNPTPLAIMSHLLVLTPTSCYLMGWGGSTSASFTALVGPYYLIGGLGLILGGIMEWILGNTFPFVVFVTFGGFWSSLAVLDDPAHGIAAAFTGSSGTAEYDNGLMLYFSFWAVACLVYFLCALRTNVVFVVIFFTLTGVFVFLAAAYGKMAVSDTDTATKLLKVSGAFGWVCICFAWYLEAALMFPSVDMPFTLPVGDLTRVWKKKTH